MQEYYRPKEIEKKLQHQWYTNNVYNVNESNKKPKYYCLSMLPYPSGKLHMGHVRNYTIGDVLARFHRFKGYNVLQPYGWDSFGLPAENAAIQGGISPAQWTYQNIKYMRYQLQSLGLAVDWSREFATCSPDYYKHQQSLFIKLYKKGIIYRKNGLVNWDPVDQTVLANEQVIDGKGWRSGADVIKKEVPMYYFKITQYAEELLEDLDNLKGWPEQVKLMQRNWIGKSRGVNIRFPYVDGYDHLTVFTTRADTLMGVTYIAISCDHPLVQIAINSDPKLSVFVTKYKQGSVSEVESMLQDKEGVFTGIYVKHPLTGEKIPVWITNYVLMNYGSGAVMAVPAHDERDFEFATKYGLPIKLVIKPHDDSLELPLQMAYTKKGILVDCGELTGLASEIALEKITAILIDKGLGETKINYRLHDWGISRQRYWGCPIPLIHCPQCGEVLLSEEQLPVILPEDLLPDGSKSPLEISAKFYNVNCPKCGCLAKRETDTMDTFVDSSWYYARYACNDKLDGILDDRVNYWLPVDQYIGGIEHAILHLLYARFFHKCLRDIGLVDSDEPFSNLLTQGMVLADTFYYYNDNGKKIWLNSTEVKMNHDNKAKKFATLRSKNDHEAFYGGMEKMSKSKNNGVDPQIIIEKYGADTARLFMLFAAPPELSLEWSDNAIEGAHRFIKKLWRLVYDHVQKGLVVENTHGELTPEHKRLRTLLHKTILKVTHDIEVRKQFNTAISSIMELLNNYAKMSLSTDSARALAQELLQSVIIMLGPIIPHVCEELWQNLCPGTSLLDQKWIEADIGALTSDEIEIIVQVNGKLRGKILVAQGLNEEQIINIAMQNANVAKFINGYELKKVISVPNKLVNIVI